MSNILHQLAGDLAAFGSHNDDTIYDASGMDLLRKLETMLIEICATHQKLANLRTPFVQEQLARLLQSHVGDLKIQIGAGPHRIDGWLNIDVYPAELQMNVRWGMPFEDGAVRYIFMSHVLEHFYFPTEALALVQECRRVLARDGTLRLIVPDVEQCLQAYVENDAAFFESRRETWTWWPEPPTKLVSFLNYAGAGSLPGDFLGSHKYGYDYETLKDLLTRAGFSRISRSGFQASPDPVLRIDNASRVAHATHEGRHYSLFVEAQP